jgi:DNA-binding transcriptional LysR family regulator
VAELTARWPALSVEVSTDTRHVSLLEEDFDAAIRIGTLALSANLARPLGAITMRLYGAPALAARLTRPAQLASMRVLRVLGPRARPAATWRGRPVDLEGTGAPVRVATFTEAAELAARAPFLTVLPSYTALPYVERGLLAPAGRGLALPAASVHLIAPTAARGSEVHAALGDALVDALARVEDALRRASL